MTRKNRLVRHAHISEAKFRALLRAFAVDLTATQIAVLTGLNRNTVNAYLTKIRRRIAEQCEQASPFAGSIEVDESFFGARRMKGKRGRGAYGKTRLCLASSNEMAKSIPKLCRIARKPRCKRLFVDVWTWRVSFTRTVGGATQAWLI